MRKVRLDDLHIRMKLFQNLGIGGVLVDSDHAASEPPEVRDEILADEAGRSRHDDTAGLATLDRHVRHQSFVLWSGVQGIPDREGSCMRFKSWRPRVPKS